MSALRCCGCRLPRANAASPALLLGTAAGRCCWVLLHYWIAAGVLGSDPLLFGSGSARHDTARRSTLGLAHARQRGSACACLFSRSAQQKRLRSARGSARRSHAARNARGTRDCTRLDCTASDRKRLGHDDLGLLGAATAADRNPACTSARALKASCKAGLTRR